MLFVMCILLNLLHSVKDSGTSAFTIGSSMTIVDMQHVVYANSFTMLRSVFNLAPHVT